MSLESVRAVGFPEFAAGHFDHFDVIGLETLVGCADARQVGRCKRRFVGTRAGGISNGAQNGNQAARQQFEPSSNLPTPESSSQEHITVHVRTRYSRPLACVANAVHRTTSGGHLRSIQRGLRFTAAPTLRQNTWESRK